MGITLITLEPTNYLDALLFQEHFFNAQLAKKKKGVPTCDTLILLQHEPVYTLGKSGKPENLKVPIEDTDAEFHKTNRGGDITFHGLGQIVAYPIFDLANFNISVREFVFKLEEIIIDCIKDYGLKGERIDSASGVWLGADSNKPRKICALGLKISRGISMHGFAFNVNTDLSYFENIVPCGLDDKAVTSLAKELGHEVNLLEVEKKLLQQFEKHFGTFF